MKEKISKIENIVLKNLNDKFQEDENSLLVLLRFGSSLHPEDMMIESDVDFLCVVSEHPEIWEDELEVYNIEDYEVPVHIYGKKKLIETLGEGNPAMIMALKFGRVIYNSDNTIKEIKESANPTEETYKIWYKNAIGSYSDDISDYFSRICMGCFPENAHHAARSFLRSFIFKDKNILCQRDKDIIDNTPKEIADEFISIRDYRKNVSYESWDPDEIDYNFTSEEGKCLLSLEKIFAFVVKEFYKKDIVTLKEIDKDMSEYLSPRIIKNEYFYYNKDKGEFDTISIIKE